MKAINVLLRERCLGMYERMYTRRYSVATWMIVMMSIIHMHYLSGRPVLCAARYFYQNTRYINVDQFSLGDNLLHSASEAAHGDYPVCA